MSGNSIFHRGERRIQERAGETALADRNAVMVTDTVIVAARPFIGRQSMVVLGSVDANGDVWASIVFGQPGFAHTGSGKSVLLEVPAEQRDGTDPVWRNIEANPSLGMLFIDLGKRRRYRVNGSVIGSSSSSIEVAVFEAYPNCPRYIQGRTLQTIGPAGLAHGMRQEAAIQDELADIVRQADTLFVASYHPTLGADVSHRGGARGFISIVDDKTLRIPDYPGNCLYNTFGNFEVNARSGLCIPDFASDRLLQLTGAAALQWEMPDPHGQTGGTMRFWDFRIDRCLLRDTPQHLEWHSLDPSPFNLPVASA